MSGEAEKALYEILKSDSEVSNQVGTRIYPWRLPQDWTSPAITYQRISGPRLEVIGGPSGRAYPSIQVDCRSRGTFAEVVDLADAVRRALDGYRGTPKSTLVTIQLLSEQDVPDERVEGAQIWRRMMEFRIRHDEAT